MSTIVRSSFQRIPAYSYIRTADKLPSTEAAQDATDPMVRVHLFNPGGAGDWWLAGYDHETGVAWGAARIHEFELGGLPMDELIAFRGRFGLPIERELGWTPRLLSQLIVEQTGQEIRGR